MKVQAEISVYPLRITELSKPIGEFCRMLRSHGLEVQLGPMSSLVSGESKDLFDAFHKSFEQLAEKYQVVVAAKLSNACPEGNDDRKTRDWRVENWL
jgi:uncharacterized protein YqgV (UPF0045/DUF77 family)